MINLTAVAQKLAQGFRVTFQFSESSPSLMMTALGVIQATPGSVVTSYDANTIVAHSSLPWELIQALRGVEDVAGVPFSINFFNWDTVAIANAVFDMHPDVLAGHLYGKSLLPQQTMNLLAR